MHDEKPRGPFDGERLRRKAMERLHTRHGSVAHMASDEIEALVHELEVYQVELEVQNEELRRAELDLARALERYRDLYDRAPVAYLTLAGDGLIVQANRAAAQLCGIDHDELEGRSLFSIALKGDRTRFDLVLRSAASTGVPQTTEFRLQCGRPMPRWVHAEVSWLGDRDERARYRVMLVDVTARVQNQAALREQRAAAVKNMEDALEARARAELITAALRESEERFRLASDAGAALVYQVDCGVERHVIVHGLERVTGFKPEEVDLTPEWWSSLIHPDDAGPHRDLLRSHEHGDGTYFSVYRLKHRIEGWILVEDTGQVVRDGKGEPLKMVGAIVDVTARQKAEVALRDADQRKDEFLATLAHELRNPLAPIRNAVQILRRDEKDTGPAHWALQVIDRQIRQMSRLVEDLLDVSRITRGQIELRRQPVDLASVVNDAIEASRPLIDEAGHALTVDLPGEKTTLDVDPTRLTQILLNLLNNSAKFTARDGKIWLSATREDSGVVFRVRDNGMGIREEMLPHVFEMFAQGERTIERALGGLGIGLTLVQRLTEMHGGSVEARSDGPGKGSEFIVRLPGSLVVTQPAPESPPESHPAPALSNGAPRRVLVVDDNRDSADSMAMFLGMTGYEVSTAHDGIAAIETANAVLPDIVLLDIGLPGLNGYDVARRIRARRGAGVVLIAMTGWGQDEDRRRALEAGFDHHLTKPVDFDKLNAVLAASEAT